MPYVQIWMKIPDTQTLGDPHPPSNEPIKRPCHPKPRFADDGADGSLHAVQVVSPHPAFFVEEPEVWEQAAATTVDDPDVIVDSDLLEQLDEDGDLAEPD